MSVACERCKADLGSDPFDPKTGLGQCDRCGLVFDPIFEPAASSTRPLVHVRARANPPAGFEAHFEEIAPISHAGESMVLYREAARKAVPRPDARGFVRWRWNAVEDQRNQGSGCAVTVGVPVTAWLAWIAYSQHVAMFGVIAIFVAALTSATAVWLAARRLNSTTIAVEGGVLRISHGPIPWWGGKVVSGADIEQIWCTRETFARASGQVKWTLVAYALEVSLGGGKTLRLIDDLASPEQALYLEQALEQALGIVDVAVPGALPEPK